jgi:hypothetical protein
MLVRGAGRRRRQQMVLDAHEPRVERVVHLDEDHDEHDVDRVLDGGVRHEVGVQHAHERRHGLGDLDDVEERHDDEARNGRELGVHAPHLEALDVLGRRLEQPADAGRHGDADDQEHDHELAHLDEFVPPYLIEREQGRDGRGRGFGLVGAHACSIIYDVLYFQIINVW